jgi:hypothetical protein
MVTPEDFPDQLAYLRRIAIDLPADLPLAYLGKCGFFELDETYL